MTRREFWTRAWELAAAAGVGSPYPYEPWELAALATARQELEWDKWSMLCSVVAAAHGVKRVKPDDFHPFAAERKRKRGSEWREFRERARRMLPSKLSDEERHKRCLQWLESGPGR